MRTKTVYVAFDDAEFDTAEACKAHEAAHVETRLVGLTAEQVRAAIEGEDVELSDAIEKIGNRIANRRREAGDYRRGRRTAGEPEAGKAADETQAQPDAAARMAEALERARAAGLAAWTERRGAVVPDAFAAAKPLHDAWLDGWREGQSGAAVAREVAA